MSNDLHTQKELVELERKLKEKHNDSSFIKGLIICLIIDAIIAGLIIGFSFLSEEMNWDRDKFIILSDAFSLPGVYTILFFLISWVSGEGAFDAISYGVVKSYTDWDLWFEPITDIVDGFVMRNKKDGSIIGIFPERSGE